MSRERNRVIYQLPGYPLPGFIRKSHLGIATSEFFLKKWGFVL
jgi:hypothetical protein